MPIGKPIDNNKNKKSMDDTQTENKHIELQKPQEPRWNFSEIILNKRIKDQIDEASFIMSHNKTLYEDWGLSKIEKNSNRCFSLNFYGPPGTGKSISAEAVATQLGKSIIKVNYSDIESKYVGDTPKNITKMFQSAKEHNAILFFDEADSILGKRLSVINSATDTSVNLTRSVMLTQLDDFSGVVIFATNFYKNYDKAFIRRIFSHIEFEIPNYEERMKLWDMYLPEKLPLANDVSKEELAKKSDQLTAADIKNSVIKAAIRTLLNNETSIRLMTFYGAIDAIKKSKQDSNKSYINNNENSYSQKKITKSEFDAATVNKLKQENS